MLEAHFMRGITFMSTDDRKPSPMQVVPADWLKPGWLFALKKTGCEATRFETPRGDALAFSKSVLAKLETIRQSPDTTGVFLSSDDCALISEYFPDYFYRTKN